MSYDNEDDERDAIAVAMYQQAIAQMLAVRFDLRGGFNGISRHIAEKCFDAADEFMAIWHGCNPERFERFDDTEADE